MGNRKRGERAHIDWDMQPLGVVPDLLLAEFLGVDGHSAMRARQHRGISPTHISHTDQRFYAKNGKTGYSRRPDWREVVGSMVPATKVPWDVFGRLLGTNYDSVIASAVGTGLSNIREQRRKRGIAPYREIRLCACGLEFTANHAEQITCPRRKCVDRLAHHRHRLKLPDELFPVSYAMSEFRASIKARKEGAAVSPDRAMEAL